MENNLKYPKNPNNYVIKHKLYVSRASFEENCAKTRKFSNTPFILRGNHFLVPGHKKDLPLFLSIFHLYKYVVIICLRVRHSVLLSFTKTHV